MITRQEHLEWCKARAREYLEVGEAEQAMASMMSDLGKHEETKGLADSMGMIYIGTLMLKPSVADARRFVEGFN